MLNLYLAQVLDDEKHREIEKAQLIRIAERSRKGQARQRLAKLACRVGLIKTC
jgi:hypothetical protein